VLLRDPLKPTGQRWTSPEYALHIGDGNDRVVERGQNVRDAGRDILCAFGLDDLLPAESSASNSAAVVQPPQRLQWQEPPPHRGPWLAEPLTGVFREPCALPSRRLWIIRWGAISVSFLFATGFLDLVFCHNQKQN